MKTPNDGFKLPGRFSPKQAALAEKIANDINEDVDCQESNRDLRMAISYWADVATVEAQRRAAIEDKLKLFTHAKRLFDAILDGSVVENKKSRRAA